VVSRTVTVLLLAVACGRWTQPPAAGGIASFEGTSWQLVKFEGGDGTTLVPDDPSKYTMSFGMNRSVTLRIDCNRGRGTWQSMPPSVLVFGPLVMQDEVCASGSLHEQMIKQWPNIRTYVIKDGHLFLSLMADGGIYEFEPRLP
jgi:para-nitrobenzyl esterase